MILSLAGGTGTPLFSVSVANPIGAAVLVLTENIGHTTGCLKKHVNISVNLASISTKLDIFHPPPPYSSFDVLTKSGQIKLKAKQLLVLSVHLSQLYTG